MCSGQGGAGQFPATGGQGGAGQFPVGGQGSQFPVTGSGQYPATGGQGGASQFPGKQIDICASLLFSAAF